MRDLRFVSSGVSSTLRVLAFAALIAAAVASSYLPTAATPEPKKHYWATSLSGSVDPVLLQGLRGAVTRGEIGWLDIDPKESIPASHSSSNLVLYHVGGNCYLGTDCNRFPSADTTGTRWDDNERAIDLYEPVVRKIVVADLVAMAERADKITPPGSIIGVHVDNVHRLNDRAIAALFNEYLAAVDLAKQQGSISQQRVIGYVAKNNPEGFKGALERRLLKTRPLYQIVENASLDRNGMLDETSQLAQEFGRRYGVPVFLKAFGSDIAHTAVRNGRVVEVPVSPEMAARMAQHPDIAGVAWSADEGSYHPTLFVQGSPVADTPLALEARD
jgi:hypothetical protein